MMQVSAGTEHTCTKDAVGAVACWGANDRGQSTVPASLGATDPRESIGKFLDLMLEEGEMDGRDRVAMSLACHGAIRAGKTLSIEEMRDLVRQLEETASPNTCPHGRPTMVHMSGELLAREFGRR